MTVCAQIVSSRASSRTLRPSRDLSQTDRCRACRYRRSARRMPARRCASARRTRVPARCRGTRRRAPHSGVRLRSGAWASLRTSCFRRASSRRTEPSSDSRIARAPSISAMPQSSANLRASRVNSPAGDHEAAARALRGNRGRQSQITAMPTCCFCQWRNLHEEAIAVSRQSQIDAIARRAAAEPAHDISAALEGLADQSFDVAAAERRIGRSADGALAADPRAPAATFGQLRALTPGGRRSARVAELVVLVPVASGAVRRAVADHTEAPKSASRTATRHGSLEPLSIQSSLQTQSI
jgi:hypothetical protein